MIVGTGAFAPEKLLTNKDLEEIVDTTDEWITTRTGMKVRHVASEGELTSDISVKAAQAALKNAGLEADDLDYIILATITGDVGFPSTACFVQEKLGAVNATAVDIAAACSGFIYGLEYGESLIAAGKAETILVIGAETLSRIVDFSDRATCVLFGDGAGAAILRPAEGDRGILGTYTKSDGRLHHLLHMPGMGTKHPPSVESIENKLNFIKMAGREVFKYAVTAMGDAADRIVNDTGLSAEEVTLMIPHQANQRIIDATAKRINLPAEKVYVNIQEYGNTSAASIPIALAEAVDKGILKKGDIVVLVAFGAGFTWGSAAIRM